MDTVLEDINGKDSSSEGLELIAVGPAIRSSKTTITGPAMMFQLLVDTLRSEDWSIHVFDITGAESKVNQRTVGQFTSVRIFHYLCLIPKIWWTLLARRSSVYLLTGPTLAAFLKDAAVIWFAILFGHGIVCHQFGNYVRFYRRQNPFVRFLIRVTLARTQAIIVEGDPVKQQFTFLPRYKQQLCVIPNGLPEQSICFPKYHKTIDEGQVIRLFYLSNMIETKGYWDVLEATRILVQDRDRHVLSHFAGSFLAAADSKRFPEPKQARSDFLRYIDQHRLSDCVSYSDGLFGKYKAEMFRKSHIFLLPSNYIYEMQPVSVLEAMAYGAVVISTNHGLIPTMVKDGSTGFLVSYGNPSEIADRVEYLMDNPRVFELLSQNSIARFQKHFKAETYCAQVKKVLKRAMV